jgi:PAS domain S-box-containing protein
LWIAVTDAFDDPKSTESDELLELAQEAGRVGVYQWHVQTGMLRLSPQFIAIYGLTESSSLTYDKWLECIFREDRPRYLNVIDTAFATRQREAEIEFRIIRQTDGEMRWIEARRIIIYDEEGRPARVVGVSADVTERKRAIVQLRNFTETLEEAVRERTQKLETEYEARKKTEELLRQAQKMEAVGQLTGGVAHDFNNLLTIIQGGLEMIGRQVAALGKVADFSRIVRGKDMAQEGVRRAARLTERLLAFARQQPLEPTTVNVNRLVADVCELLRRTVGEAIAVETVLAGGIWATQVDANQLENAVLNLALNARDAMPDGGKLTFETANCHLDDAYVGGLAEPVNPGQYVMISISDTGMGMDRATLERAFEPFFTTKGIGKGTGLGLSQVYGFVRQSAGHVAIYSEVGEGATVKVYLPRHHGEEEAEVRHRSAGSNQSLGAETILVVEDDETLRLYTVELLSDLGYSVLAAANGPAALEMIGQNQHIDLLFTDVVMPGGMNGRQLADEAAKLRPGLKVLFTTGYTVNAIVHHGRLDPGVELISKPFTYESLGSKIRSLLDR